MTTVLARTSHRSADPLLRLLEEVDDGLVRQARPELAQLVNWSEARQLPLHRWFRYREGFSPSLIDELDLGDRILDPFCGSGSILVGAATRGRAAVGIDVNPLAAFVARVKLTPLADNELSDALRFAEGARKAVRAARPTEAPELRIAEKVFEPDILEALLRLQSCLERVGEERLHNFLRLAWVSILQDVGSYFKEGNGIKYRNRKRLKSGYVQRTDGEWQLERFGADQASFVLDAFERQVRTMVDDASVWASGTFANQRVVEGNSLEEAHSLDTGSFSSVIFSPPYANRFDYFESQKVELWFGGFVRSYDDMNALRKRSVRSHLGAALTAGKSSHESVEKLIALIDPTSYAVRMRVPALLRGYFDDMKDIVSSCRRVLRPGGRCYIVVGNSAYGGMIVPTDSLIARLGLDVGFDSADVVPVRHLTVAPQQRNELVGREQYMRESVVVLG